MTTRLVFETHAITEDNERGVATGWWPGRLSTYGRELAVELGRRRRTDVDVVFTSDLARATETAALAFAGTGLPVLADWRLRECDYGDLNGAPAPVVHGDRAAHLDVAYPAGESWREAVERAGGFLRDLPGRWAGRRLLVIGHLATRWALDHHLSGIPLETLVGESFGWQAGWEYQLP